MQNSVVSPPTGDPPQPRRIYYIDWLRVLAILMVFLFHSTHIFDFTGWQIKNAEQSLVVTIILIVLSLWGMPFFFLVAGASSWFALERRSSKQYVSERFNRLLIPFIIGALLFSPIQYYLSWLNKVQLGTLSVSFQEFLRSELPPFNPLLLRFPGWSPRWMAAGFHLWFIGFLFFFAIFTLPLFRWLRGEAGMRFVARLGRLCEHRGAILVLVIPLIAIQLVLRPYFTWEHDWHDFIFRMGFFILGYLLFTDERLTAAVRRDWWLLLGLGTAIVLGLLGMYLFNLPVMDWSEDPSTIQFYLIQGLTTTVAFCYTLTMVFVGMRFLDFTNPWLRYGQEAALPFFVLHQPAIVIIGFFVVLWDAGIPLKMLAVILSAFVVCIGIYELVIRRTRPLRLAFGMKA
jgi:glucans biosynthesis protein C